MKTVELYKYKEINGHWHEYWVRRLTFEPIPYTDANVGILTEKMKDLGQKYKSFTYKKLIPSKSYNPMYGYCYPSTQALYYLFDTDKLVPMKGTDYRKEIHWWLQDDKKIIDITAEQYYNVGQVPPYDNGKKGEWYAWRKQPSMKAFDLIVNIMSPNISDKSVYIHKEEYIHHNPLFS